MKINSLRQCNNIRGFRLKNKFLLDISCFRVELLTFCEQIDETLYSGNYFKLSDLFFFYYLLVIFQQLSPSGLTSRTVLQANIIDGTY